jgi:hypothetical protein
VWYGVIRIVVSSFSPPPFVKGGGEGFGSSVLIYWGRSYSPPHRRRRVGVKVKDFVNATFRLRQSPSLVTVTNIMNLEKTEIWLTTEEPLEFSDGRSIGGEI